MVTGREKAITSLFRQLFYRLVVIIVIVVLVLLMSICAGQIQVQVDHKHYNYARNKPDYGTDNLHF